MRSVIIKMEESLDNNTYYLFCSKKYNKYCLLDTKIVIIHNDKCHKLSRVYIHIYIYTL